MTGPSPPFQEVNNTVDAGSIWIRLGLDPENLLFGLDKARYGLTEWRDQTNKNSMEMAKWGATIGATVAPVLAVGFAAYSTIEKFGGMAQEIKDLSYTTGLSTQKIQELQYAATLSGTQFPTVTMAVDNLTLAIAKAGDATSDAGGKRLPRSGSQHLAGPRIRSLKIRSRRL